MVYPETNGTDPTVLHCRTHFTRRGTSGLYKRKYATCIYWPTLRPAVLYSGAYRGASCQRKEKRRHYYKLIYRRTRFMTKESKILLATVIVCTILLAGLDLFLHRQAVSLNLRAAQEINKAVKATPSATPVVET